MAYGDEKLEALLLDRRKLQRKYGADNVKVIAKRLTALRSSQDLAELHQLPGRTHPLGADRAGTIAMNLVGGFRRIFRPTPPVPQRSDGGIDVARVTRVTVTEISDHYN